MAHRPVVLGWPISLILRGINTLSSAGLSTSKIAGLTLGTGGALLASSYAPWLSSLASSGSETAPAGASTQTDPITIADIGGILTFFDMNAEMVTISEKRRIAVVSVPGRESDFLQDLGGHTVRYSVRGRFFDTDPQYLTHRGIMQTILKTFVRSGAVGSTQMLRLLMRTASPVPFITEHEVSFAIVSDFSFSQVGGEPQYVNYSMELLEYGRIPYLAKMAILGAGNWAGELLG